MIDEVNGLRAFNIWDMATMKQRKLLGQYEDSAYQKVIESILIDADGDINIVPNLLREALGV